MKTGLVLLTIISVVLMFATTGYAQDNTTDNATDNTTDNAVAILKDAENNTVGFATFTEDFGLVRIQILASGLTPGLHGIHIHETANCTEPSFTSAGEHYNPLGKEHGLANPKGPHAGDLPNLIVGYDGTAYMDVVTNLVTLSPGSTTLFTDNGTALVIHADRDDQITNPSGGSGERIACGVIEKR